MLIPKNPLHQAFVDALRNAAGDTGLELIVVNPWRSPGVLYDDQLSMLGIALDGLAEAFTLGVNLGTFAAEAGEHIAGEVAASAEHAGRPDVFVHPNGRYTLCWPGVAVDESAVANDG